MQFVESRQSSTTVAPNSEFCSRFLETRLIDYKVWGKKFLMKTIGSRHVLHSEQDRLFTLGIFHVQRGQMFNGKML